MLWNLMWIVPAVMVLVVVGKCVYYCRPFHWLAKLMRLDKDGLNMNMD